MSLLCGTCHPRPRTDPSYYGPTFREDEMKLASKWYIGLPVCVEHFPNKVVGEIKSFRRGAGGELICELFIDHSTKLGREVMDGCKSGLYKGLSMGFDMRFNEERHRFTHLKPIEISIVQKGAMEGTHILYFGNLQEKMTVTPHGVQDLLHNLNSQRREQELKMTDASAAAAVVPPTQQTAAVLQQPPMAVPTSLPPNPTQQAEYEAFKNQFHNHLGLTLEQVMERDRKGAEAILELETTKQLLAQKTQAAEVLFNAEKKRLEAVGAVLKGPNGLSAWMQAHPEIEMSPEVINNSVDSLMNTAPTRPDEAHVLRACASILSNYNSLQKLYDEGPQKPGSSTLTFPDTKSMYKQPAAAPAVSNNAFLKLSEVYDNASKTDSYAKMRRNPAPYSDTQFFRPPDYVLQQMQQQQLQQQQAAPLQSTSVEISSRNSAGLNQAPVQLAAPIFTPPPMTLGKSIAELRQELKSRS